MKMTLSKPSHIRLARGVAFATVLCLAASSAHAQTATVDATANTLYNTMFTLAKIVAGIAFLGAGMAKLVGRMNWGHFGAVCIGCLIMASSQWLVTTIFGG